MNVYNPKKKNQNFDGNKKHLDIDCGFVENAFDDDLDESVFIGVEVVDNDDE